MVRQAEHFAAAGSGVGDCDRQIVLACQWAFGRERPTNWLVRTCDDERIGECPPVIP
jgi:hypothetical protein